jgi:peptidylprolyl isomerase
MKNTPLITAAILGLCALPALPLSAAAAAPPKEPQMAAADFRPLDPENTLVIDTGKGRIVVEMYPDIAPAAVARIKSLARSHFYDGLTFHRVIDDFMAQGGDPKGDGSGGSTLPNLPGEFIFRRGSATPYFAATVGGGLEDGFYKALPIRTQSSDLMALMADGKVRAWGLWCPGVAGMARTGDPNTGNSQYFLMRGFTDQLEKNYTVWGRAIVGLDVVQALAVGDPPTHPDIMKAVRVMADLPPADQPKVQVLDTMSPSFQALVAYDKTLHGGSFSVCDVTLPVR